MSPRMSDHDLTVLVETAAQGMWDSKAAHEGGPLFAELPNPVRNSIREAALPYVFHATKALADLGYTKPRLIVSLEELDALPVRSVLLTHGNKFGPLAVQKLSKDDPSELDYRSVGLARGYSADEIHLPATVIHEVTA